MVDIPSPPLKGAKALVVGVANEHSIAYGCAKAFHETGADVALTYLNEKAKPHVEPVAKELEAQIFMPLDVSQEGMLEAVFDEIRQKWGRLDILAQPFSRWSTSIHRVRTRHNNSATTPRRCNPTWN